MKLTVAEPWIEEPLRRFIEDARVLNAILLAPSGQVLGQSGFTRSMDVMAACALAAAIHASASELGRQLDGRPFSGLHHAGRDKQIFLSATETQRGVLLLLTVFDTETSLGLVQLYFSEMSASLVKAAPPKDEGGVALPETFERDLNRSLAVLFGRAQTS